MKEAFIVPLKGLLVRDPSSKNPLAEQGEVKPMSGSEGTYWKRRIIDGSVRVGESPISSSNAEVIVENSTKSVRRKTTNVGE